MPSIDNGINQDTKTSEYINLRLAGENKNLRAH